MNDIWQAFLSNQGASFAADGISVQTFGIADIEHHSMRHGPVMTSLMHWGLIRISGDDARDFLQAQLTQDVALVTPTQAQPAAYCDPQGQLLGFGTLFLYHGAWYWLVARDTVRPLLSRLKMFVMRSKVELEDFSDLLPRFGYAGTHAPQDLLVQLDLTLDQPYQQAAMDKPGLEDVAVIRLPAANHCYLFIGPHEALINSWEVMETNGMGVGAQDWELLALAWGMPQVTAALQGKVVAQLMNMDRIGAINFKKGCYPGQEVIARLHYRGKPTKRMMRMHCQRLLNAQPADELTLHYGDGRSTPVTLVRVGKDYHEGSLLLAIASLKATDEANGEFHLDDGTPVVVEPMGYPLTDPGVGA